MIKTHEITMDNKDKSSDISMIRVTIRGLDRNSAVLRAESEYPGFTVRYIIAGHEQTND